MATRDPDIFDLVVVGGGHAGCEAALAAARLGRRVALATLREETIGALSCNPAVGGIGKGQLARELDALGGAMARITDETAVHYRMLNTSKGEAVRSLRAQVDKELYSRAMRRLIASTPGVTVIEGSVEGLRIEAGRAAGVRLGDGSEVRSRWVILTNGTFLRGLMHTGEAKQEGGRIGEGAIAGLTGALLDLGFESGRLKTGTPPRLHRDSLDLERTTVQSPDPEPDGFSHFLPPPRREWMDCHITRTCERTHEIIRRNLDRSPMYAGEIEGIGPRYCPSVEDKVVRFPDRDGHTVHLEREGWSTDSIYVNGISTSLPADAQEELVATIPGLERAVFLRHGYAVEYDFFPPHQIEVTFESRLLPGLSLAGQICGTSGYEEAAVQGFLAGVNAARLLVGEEPFVLGRDEAYMGVLADDLVRCDPREPYRMFTSRAEFRLLLRHDNADLRLVERGVALGLLSPEHGERVAAKREMIEGTLDRLRSTFSGTEQLLQRLRRPGAEFGDLAELHPEVDSWQIPPEIQDQVRIHARYESYIERQAGQIETLRRLEAWSIPSDFDPEELAGLRREAVEKLKRLRPRTLGAARRIAGVTPADLSILLVGLRARGVGGGLAPDPAECPPAELDSGGGSGTLPPGAARTSGGVSRGSSRGAGE
ncbi:MAG: tRNA uridine-5-carboxymethylaminomethyl(34) synthesis enzyme MnmG [Planctomycetota bacterium]|jgi:tRNA uridine 5-carboxymethylaminomethyl modification enzyme